MSLSKTLFLRGLQCHKSLWLFKHRPELIPPTSSDKQAIYDEGTLVGELARTYFPNGHHITAEYPDIKKATTLTESAIKNGDNILYEPAVRFEDVLIRADILKRANGSNKGWDLIEVKASTEEKEIHLPDLAIQRYVLEGSGLPIHKTYLMLIDNQYVRNGEINVRKLFKLEDVTTAVKKLLPSIPQDLKTLRQVLSQKKVPDIEIGAHCYDPYECEFISHCWKHIPAYSIYDLIRAGWEKKEILRSYGILKIDEIPDDFNLTQAQELQVEVEKTGRPHIDEPAIKELLDELEYPLYFLDFETINPAIPPYNGIRPYQQTPFQFSLRLHDKNGKTKHIEFLGDGKNDPRSEVARLLAENIGSKGSVVVYTSFENRILEDLATVFPKYKKALLSARDRIWDLYIPFSKRYYVHPKFSGSASIKDVLPALVPEMSYEGMEIAEGGQASQAYLDMMTEKLTEKESAKVRANLLKYCGQDTLAMVKILKVLK